jgi:hypothetical protein
MSQSAGGEGIVICFSITSDVTLQNDRHIFYTNACSSKNRREEWRGFNNEMTVKKLTYCRNIDHVTPGMGDLKFKCETRRRADRVGDVGNRRRRSLGTY